MNQESNNHAASSVAGSADSPNTIRYVALDAAPVSPASRAPATKISSPRLALVLADRAGSLSPFRVAAGVTAFAQQVARWLSDPFGELADDDATPAGRRALLSYLENHLEGRAAVVKAAESDELGALGAAAAAEWTGYAASYFAAASRAVVESGGNLDFAAASLGESIDDALAAGVKLTAMCSLVLSFEDRLDQDEREAQRDAEAICDAPARRSPGSEGGAST